MRITAVVVPMLLVACGSAATPTETRSEAVKGGTPAWSGRSVLVTFRNGIDRGAVQRAGGEIRKEWAALGAVAARMPEAAIEGLSHNPNVESVELDRVVQAAAITGSGEDTWGNVAVHADVTRAAGITGQGITVCVMDTGVDFWHPEFANLAIFDTTNNAKPVATPLAIICATPPRRAGRMENPADTSAIVAVSSGNAIKAWKCNR